MGTREIPLPGNPALWGKLRIKLNFFLIILLSTHLVGASPSSLEKDYRALRDRAADLRSKLVSLKNSPVLERATYLPQLVQGRLTLTSATPVTSSDVSGASTIYFTPYGGNKVATYSGSMWTLVTFSEISLALSGLTSGKNYDVFFYHTTGTPALELSAAWTDDSTRADAISLQDGVWVKTGATSRRYLGTLRTTSTTTTADTKSQRYLWNYYNRRRKPLLVTAPDSPNSWSFVSSAWRSVNADANMKVSFVVGIAPALVRATAVRATQGTSTNYAPTGIGLDSATTNAAILFGNNADSSNYCADYAVYQGYPAAGYRELNWIERADSAAVTLGDAGQDPTTGIVLTGLQGDVEG